MVAPIERPEKKGVYCTECGHAKSEVKQTFRKAGRIERVRKCLICKARFGSVEVATKLW
jgi:transcriptional regulator NrdR family protein